MAAASVTPGQVAGQMRYRSNRVIVGASSGGWTQLIGDNPNRIMLAISVHFANPIVMQPSGGPPDAAMGNMGFFSDEYGAFKFKDFGAAVQTSWWGRATLNTAIAAYVLEIWVQPSCGDDGNGCER